MKPRQFKRQQKKQVLKSLDKIYTISKSTCKIWSVKNVPLKMLCHTIDLCKVDVKDDNKYLMEVVKTTNDMFDRLKEEFKKGAKKMKVDYVPLELIKELIRLVKQKYIQGLKKPISSEQL